VRARRTAEIVGRALVPILRPELWPELDSGRPALPIFSRLRIRARPDRTVVIVGHEPALSEFIGLALTGETVAFAHLTKGGAACLEFPRSVRPGSARLLWLLTRKQLAAKGG
jgi:phosphohistidine phosphatase SixA